VQGRELISGGKPDVAAVHARIVAFLPRLRRFCRVLTGAQDRADDLVQATVERALQRIEQWQEGTNLESWMFRIARNMHIDQIRMQAGRGRHVDIDEAETVADRDALSGLEARSDLERVQGAMRTLPEEQRTLLSLVVLEEMSYREAAELLDIPIGTVMSRLARARRALDLALHGPAGTVQ